MPQISLPDVSFATTLPSVATFHPHQYLKTINVKSGKVGKWETCGDFYENHKIKKVTKCKCQK